MKDGDYNTSFSKTVLPLPAHGHPDYEAASATPTLEEDPVYQRHRDDWQTFHTRFVVAGRVSRRAWRAVADDSGPAVR